WHHAPWPRPRSPRSCRDRSRAPASAPVAPARPGAPRPRRPPRPGVRALPATPALPSAAATAAAAHRSPPARGRVPSRWSLRSSVSGSFHEVLKAVGHQARNPRGPAPELAVEPLQARLADEPRPLALRVADGVALHPAKRLGLAQRAAHDQRELAVSDPLHGRERWVIAPGEQRAHLVGQSCRHHSGGAALETLGKNFTWQGKADGQDALRVILDAPPPLLRVPAPAARPHQLEGPDDP